MTAAVLTALLALVLLPPCSAAGARPPTGNVVRPQAYKPQQNWPSSVTPDPRAEFVVPVNVVRIYSDEHNPGAIAPRKWINVQLQVANLLFRLKDDEMRRHSTRSPAPIIQFRLNKVIDVHEREVAEILGKEVDTECVYGWSPEGNGSKKAETDNLRSLKVTDGEQFLTVYCVYDIKNAKDDTGSIGGESNVGFASRPPTGPRRALVKVTATRAQMGVVIARWDVTWYNTIAHEFGHYFGLLHAWERERNRPLAITGLGQGPKSNVDTDREYANVMDYDNGEHVNQYFAKCQLEYMHKFCGVRATQEITVVRNTGGGTGGGEPPASALPSASIARVWADAPTPGGKVTLHAALNVANLAGKGANLVAWFYDASGNKLSDTDGRFRASNGQVALSRKFKTPHANTQVGDIALTLPPGQLHLSSGRHEVSATLAVFFGQKMLTTAKPVKFTYLTPSAPGDDAVAAKGRPAAWFKSAEVTTVNRKDAKWLKIATGVLLDHMVGKDVRIQSRFHFPGGSPLRDYDREYRSPEGLVMGESRITPKYTRTRVGNWTIWIPVRQLHLAQGRFRLSARLVVTLDGLALASRSQSFTLNTTGIRPPGVRPPPPAVSGPPVRRPPSGGPSARIARVWVTHNHRSGGELGVVVHSQIMISDLRGRPVSVFAWFWLGQGKPLKDFDKRYATRAGQVSASVTVTPKYDRANFTDVGVFIPYSQFHLGYGAYRLGVNVGAFSGGRQIGSHRQLSWFQVTRTQQRK